MEYVAVVLLLFSEKKKNIKYMETRLTTIILRLGTGCSIVGQDIVCDIVCDIIIPVAHHYTSTTVYLWLLRARLYCTGT